MPRRSRAEAEALHWARGLHRTKRGRLWMLLGNVFILFALLGVPYLRGRARAKAALRAYAEFASCLYGLPVASEPGVASDPAEARLLAAMLFASEGGWPRTCEAGLLRIAPEHAIFVLPSVKQTEELLRSELAQLRRELLRVDPTRRLAGVPSLPLRALSRVRESLRMNAERAGILAVDQRFAVRVPAQLRFAEPGRLPLYAAPDARVRMWGDDRKLHLTAIDQTGLSYLESEPGKPFLRARMVRPGNLRGFADGSQRPLLVWATSPRRCRERATGCQGKSSGLASFAWPLLELPSPRWLSAHVAGTPERSVVQDGDRLWLATEVSGGRIAVGELPLHALQQGDDAQAEQKITLDETWTAAAEQVLLLAAEPTALAFGLTTEDAQLRLTRLTRAGSVVVGSVAKGSEAWLAGCAHGRQAGLVFGSESALRLAVWSDDGTRLWPPIPLATRQVHAEDGQRADRVTAVCNQERAAAVVVDAERHLQVVTCSEADGCSSIRLGDHVDGYALVQTGKQLLIAYGANHGDLQLRTRTFDLQTGQAGPERVPGACFSPRSGMCGAPLLARVGKRLLLAAHEGTDLVALESSDEGESWHRLQVY